MTRFALNPATAAVPEYRHVADLEAALADIEASGGRVLRSGIVLPSGLGVLARVRDREGRTLTLFSATPR